jgi:hypothetical protein
MGRILDQLAWSMLDATLAAVAVSGLVALVIVQSRQPARRRVWARAGLLATLTLIPIAAIHPVARLELSTPIRRMLPVTQDGWNLSDFAGPGRERVVGPARCEAGTTPPPPAIWAVRALAGGYLVVALAGVAWTVLGVWGPWILGRRAFLPSPDTRSLYDSLPFRDRRRPGLIVLERTAGTALVGIIRPVVVIPPDLDRPESADRLRLGLLHELAHAESGDHWYAAAATLACSVWFFLPTVRWIREQLRLDQEFLADRWAVGHFGSTSAYASSLVAIASSRPIAETSSRNDQPTTRREPTASALLPRILMLIRCPFLIEGRPPGWWRWASLGSIACVTILASSLTLRGLATGALTFSSPTTTPTGSFHLADLTLGAGEGRDQPFDLRYRLPEEFTLTLELQADPSELPALEVLGHRLNPPPNHPTTNTSPKLDWHLVRIRRQAGTEQAWLDDIPLTVADHPARLTQWLTLKAHPTRATRYRNLEIAW